jgi:hypothetical protein
MVIRRKRMANPKETNRNLTDLVPVESLKGVSVLPPNSGFVGRFLEEAENMFKARAMRMNGLLRRINESGQQTEALLRMAAERMEAAQSKIAKDLQKEGLLSESGADESDD